MKKGILHTTIEKLVLQTKSDLDTYINNDELILTYVNLLNYTKSLDVGNLLSVFFKEGDADFGDVFLFDEYRAIYISFTVYTY